MKKCVSITSIQYFLDVRNHFLKFSLFIKRIHPLSENEQCTDVNSFIKNIMFKNLDYITYNF